MKNILALLLLTMSLLAHSQKNKSDTSALFTVSRNSGFAFSYLNYPNDPSFAMIWDDGRIEIVGDTMQAIRSLVQVIKSKDSTLEAAYEVIGAGVNFVNQIPDYWKDKKNNCAWSHYWALLRKQGFRESKSKQSKPCK